MNIREFAKQCGVSASAISRILNNSQKNSQASNETYERIKRLAVEFGYKPNYAAKALHTRKSNFIGIIISNPTFINTFAMIKGASVVTSKYGYSINIASCDNSLKKEKEAFEGMLYKGVDGIVWHPTFQKGKYRTEHVESVLDKYRKKIPIVCLSCNDMPGIFKFMSNWEEDAALAADRHLQCGCKKFGVLRSEYTVPFVAAAATTYKKTLLERGILPKDIVEIVLERKNVDWNLLQGVEGIWVYYLFTLHELLPHLKKVCSLKTLHIDGTSFAEDRSLTEYVYSHIDGGFESQFGSLQHHYLEGREIARRGTEIAIQAIADPTLEPFVERVAWRLSLQDNRLPTLLV